MFSSQKTEPATIDDLIFVSMGHDVESGRGFVTRNTRNFDSLKSQSVSKGQTMTADKAKAPKMKWTTKQWLHKPSQDRVADGGDVGRRVTGHGHQVGEEARLDLPQSPGVAQDGGIGRRGRDQRL